MEWETAEIETKTLYKAFSPKEIEAHIGMKIGLRGVNITMKGWLQRYRVLMCIRHKQFYCIKSIKSVIQDPIHIFGLWCFVD